jgi:hypothetical protein
MRRWFLSYHSPDQALAEGLKVAIEQRDAQSRVFFAPTRLRAGGFWSAQLASEIADATAFVLLVGEKGLGPWQVLEYDEALDRRVKSPDFPVVLMLREGTPAPGLPFLRRLHWIVTTDPASEKSLAQLIDATSAGNAPTGELWRYASPYRGLAAMEEKDSDYFFGRERETIEVLSTLATAPDKLPVLLGNSGVGKSSLAQAGVLAALKRQAWPESAAAAPTWPHAFHDSRRWCFLTIRPGVEPVRSLVEAFLETWQLDRVSTDWPRRRAEWVDGLVHGKLTLRDLLDQTGRRYAALQQAEPPAFLVYIDQGEELYVRAEESHRRRFSDILAQGVGDPRLRALMSLRADFLGELQKDEPLYGVHRQISVPPLREAELTEVVTRPAALLGARFEASRLAADIARRAAEESAKDAGALPLLSYLLDDMWTQMVERGDGVLRLPPHAMELGGVLAERANAFLAAHPNAEEMLRRVLTLKLATVREDGEPTRRRALRSEFDDAEWRLVSELADHPNRLLVTAKSEKAETSKDDETYAEVAHEAIFRRWDQLRHWIAQEREFLIWRNELEGARRRWQTVPEPSKGNALLMGLALAQAQAWLVKRAQDLSAAEREFINDSLNRETLERERRERLRRRFLVAAAAAAVTVTIIGGIIWSGANGLNRAWDEVRRVRESDKLLVLLASDSSRLQNLIHRYIGQPSGDGLKSILGMQSDLLVKLHDRASLDPMLSASTDELRAVTEQFLAGFEQVREVQSAITKTYENDVLKPAKDMAGLYAIIEGAMGRRDALLLPSLSKSREAFTASLVSANAFYLSLASEAADEARRNLTTVEQTIPVMIDLAENDLQRTALTLLAQRAVLFRNGLTTLSEQFATRSNLLKTAIDDNQAAMIALINRLSGQMTERERQAQTSFDATLANIYRNVGLAGIICLVVGSGLFFYATRK